MNANTDEKRTYSKRLFVREPRPMNNTDNYTKMDKFDVRAPVYSASLIEALNLGALDSDGIKAEMKKQTPKNVIVKDAPVMEGFMSFDDVFEKESKDYTNLAGVSVKILVVMNTGKKGLFDGVVSAIDGLKVAVTLDSGTVIMCSPDVDDPRVWFFN